jgi:hypothetical protein
MARFTLSFRCLEETGEESPSDSPYFLVYAGEAQKQKSDVQLVRRASWDDTVDAGEPVRSTTVLMPTISRPDLVLVALLEEDWDTDSGVVESVRAVMKNHNTLIQLAINDPEIYILFKEQFETAITNALHNDDLIKVRRIISSQFIDFVGEDGAHYRVRLAA